MLLGRNLHPNVYLRTPTVFLSQTMLTKCDGSLKDLLYNEYHKSDIQLALALVSCNEALTSGVGFDDVAGETWGQRIKMSGELQILRFRVYSEGQ